MKKFILIVVMCLISNLSLAAYTCNDREYLQSILTLLNQSCGSPIATCESVGYKASTPEGAIKACSEAGYHTAYCHQQVKCTAHTNICESAGYKASTSEGAIKSCNEAGYSVAFCHQQVKCTKSL